MGVGRRLWTVVFQAGPAAACFLADQGHHVTIFDRVEDLAPVGAGIGIQPIGMSVLHRLGVLGPVMQHGSRVDRLHGVTHRDGRAVLDLSYADLDPRLFGLGLHRGVLLAELLKAMEARQDSIEVCPGEHVTRLEHQADGKVSIRTAGKWAGDPFDLIVVADGTKSCLRDSLPWPSHRREYPFGCLWAILPDEEGVFSQSHTLSQVYDGTQVMLGFLPSGHLHGQLTATAPATVSLFWSIRLDHVDRWRNTPIQQWKDTVLSLEPRAEGVLQRVTSHDDLAVASYSDVTMGKFGAGPVVSLGDCAHAMSPQLGQGANVALVDAWKLSKAVKQSIETLPSQADSHSVASHATKTYSDDRRWRMWFYQLNSRILTPVFQSDSRVISVLRDTFMGPLCRFPPTRRQMLATMSGALSPNWISLIPDEEYLAFLDDECMMKQAL